jgi:cytoskeletal protein RodZ
MLFEQKKINIETLSEYLGSIRQSLNLSREDVAKKTGIKLKFLECLESNDFKPLPADVYVMGFLRQLAEVYAISPVDLIQQYKKEKNIEKQVIKQIQLLNSGRFARRFNKIVITPKILSLILGLVFVGATLSYIGWQLWSIDRTPSLAVNQPQDNSVISGAFVNVSGHTDPGADVSVNGENIFVDAKGDFNTQAALSSGPEEITIMSQNRFGKSVSKTINVTGAVSIAPTSGPLQLGLSFTGPVVINFAADNQSPQTITFSAGDSKVFTATQEILISTSDAGATKVNLNGQNLGPMGRPKEQLSNMQFVAQSATTTSTK